MQNTSQITYPIGVQEFEKLRSEDYIYVDKTAYIHQLVTTGVYYFLSRPRRFGKSLLLSTMRAYFEGRRELFRGLAIDALQPQEWKASPVLYLDLNIGKYVEPGELESVLNDAMTGWEQKFDLPTQGATLALRFKNIVQNLGEKQGHVVILIDEYDKPMLQTIGNPELQRDHRETLKPFYGVLKTMDRYIRFAFLTGVTKFGKVSVFSDLNNLEDLSMLPQYNAICGITEQELHRYFRPSIEALAAQLGKTVEETAEILRVQYDGYHFMPDSEGIYNPFSLLNTLKNKLVKGYWFETGTPTFLVELLRRSNYNLRNLQREIVNDDILNSVDSLSANPVPVIYQSGYLTIKEHNKRFNTYRLGFPNQEVEEGFTRFLLPYYTPRTNEEGLFFIQHFIEDLEEGNAEQFMQRLQAFFAGGNYQVAGDKELYFQNSMNVLIRLLGFYTRVEDTTAQGRIDLTVQTPDYIYLFEMKLDGSVREALQQIEERGYADRFAMDSRPLFKIGVNFSSETRGVAEWEIRQDER